MSDKNKKAGGGKPPEKPPGKSPKKSGKDTRVAKLSQQPLKEHRTVRDTQKPPSTGPKDDKPKK